MGALNKLLAGMTWGTNLETLENDSMLTYLVSKVKVEVKEIRTMKLILIVMKTQQMITKNKWKNKKY